MRAETHTSKKKKKIVFKMKHPLNYLEEKEQEKHQLKDAEPLQKRWGYFVSVSTFPSTSLARECDIQ